MILDALLLVSNSQAVTATAGSTNVIDLGAPTVRNRVGSGEPVGFVVCNDVAADFTTGDETYTVQILASATENMASPTVIASVALAAAQRAIGSQLFIGIPKGQPILRFLALNYVTAGTTPTWTVTAGLVPSTFVDDQVHYAKGYST